MKKKRLFEAAFITAAAFIWTGSGRTGHPAWAELCKWRYAHRGYHDKPQIPENSIPAFKRAIERGWGAELDVHLLKDGTLAVFHDSDLMRCAGAEGVIEDLTKDELAGLRLEGTDNKVPLLDEVLELFEGKAPLIIELKTYGGNHRALAEAVCKRLDTYDGDFCIESFDPRAIAEVRRLRPWICRGQLAQDFIKRSEGLPAYQRVLLTTLRTNFLSRPDFIAYRFEDRHNIFLRLCVRSGVQEVNWTIDSKEDMLAAEADGALVIFERFDPDE
ncbi:MAG: glycerophosphodiester phosphodiesterase [Firmicutes bacterium]|nr:glycerophosphodiester phosphodiesterase [Bacillota bacterium]